VTSYQRGAFTSCERGKPTRLLCPSLTCCLHAAVRRLPPQKNDLHAHRNPERSARI